MSISCYIISEVFRRHNTGRHILNQKPMICDGNFPYHLWSLYSIHFNNIGNFFRTFSLISRHFFFFFYQSGGGATSTTGGGGWTVHVEAVHLRRV